MAIRGKLREGLFKWIDEVSEEDDYWVFENNDWLRIPLKLRDWDDGQAVEVPVPKRPMKVNNKEKD